jgi:hypothetical protein
MQHWREANHNRFWVAGLLATLIVSYAVGFYDGRDSATPDAGTGVPMAAFDAREEALQEEADRLSSRKDRLDDRASEIREVEREIEEGSIPGNGIWLVGEDIAPGTYRAQGESEDDCYWARLSGLGGESEDVIANYLGSAATSVEIKNGDRAFETDGCGDWRLSE